MLEIFRPNEQVNWSVVLEAMADDHAKAKLCDYWQYEIAEQKWGNEYRNVVSMLHPVVEPESVASAFEIISKRFPIWQAQLREGAAAVVDGMCSEAKGYINDEMTENSAEGGSGNFTMTHEKTKELLDAATKLSNALANIRPHLLTLKTNVAELFWSENVAALFNDLLVFNEVAADTDITPAADIITKLDRLKLSKPADIEKVWMELLRM